LVRVAVLPPRRAASRRSRARADMATYNALVELANGKLQYLYM
jgi:hypothetical protein